MKNATLHGWPRIDRRVAARVSSLLSRSGIEDGWPENADVKFPNVGCRPWRACISRRTFDLRRGSKSDSNAAFHEYQPDMPFWAWPGFS